MIVRKIMEFEMEDDTTNEVFPMKKLKKLN